MNTSVRRTHWLIYAQVAPCFVIAKGRGLGQRGVMAPNPYHQDLDYWAALRGHVRARAGSRPFPRRAPRVFWRGHIVDKWHPVMPGRGAPCESEFGNHARLKALSGAEINRWVRCT